MNCPNCKIEIDPTELRRQWASAAGKARQASLTKDERIALATKASRSRASYKAPASA